VDLGEAGPLDRLAARSRRFWLGRARARAGLRAKLLAPLQLLVKGKAQLFIAADGELARVPFGKLLAESAWSPAGEARVRQFVSGRELQE
jgi:hypothetical protein